MGHIPIRFGAAGRPEGHGLNRRIVAGGATADADHRRIHGSQATRESVPTADRLPAALERLLLLRHGGRGRREADWEYQYRRCRTCGFTVRIIFRPIPDEALLGELRAELAKAFVRNVPDY